MSLSNPLERAAAFLSAQACLQFLWARWTECHLPAATRDALKAACVGIPTIPKIGLEMELGEDASRVDLHQLVTRLDGAPGQLKAALASGSLFQNAAWSEGLRHFLDLWCEPEGPYGEAFPRLLLEYDLVSGNTWVAEPSLFLDIYGRSTPPDLRKGREKLALDAIDLLRRDNVIEPSRAQLRRCFEAVEGLGSIGHLGVMLGRSKPNIRVNIKDLGHGALGPALKALGWPGSIAAAERIFEPLIDEADRVTVALDRGEEWRTTIGFEVFIIDSPYADKRWARFMDSLCAQQLCTSQQSRSILTLPGVGEPGRPGPRWPAPWIIAAALAPPDHLPRFRSAISHVKLTLDADGGTQAKAYVSALHEWRRPDSPPAPARRIPSSLSLAARLEEAVDAAQGFLIQRVSQGGAWRDFNLGIGMSDEWVTAFIGAQLAIRKNSAALTCAQKAWRWLGRRQRPSGGWGYNAISPPDADSTAWALRLASMLGDESGAVRRGQAFLAQHIFPDGRVATYAATTPIHLNAVALGAVEATGWRDAHACVAANAAQVLGGETLVALRETQESDGSWRAYWWREDDFATGLAIETLASMGDKRDQARIERAIDWAHARGNPEASAFDLAWRLRLLRFAGDTPDLRRLVEALLDLQSDDGGWPAGAAMLFHLPHQPARGIDSEIHLDHKRHFTTASALGALALVSIVLR